MRGKVEVRAFFADKGEDHPRVCGEKPRCYRLKYCTLGSPPRMRGKVVPAPVEVKEAGITPACAGKSLSGVRYPMMPEDHPRVCGEKCRNVLYFSSIEGSPPRVRGKEALRSALHPRSGITPACAGKSQVAELCPQSVGDHPRVCGEKQCL